MTPKPESETDPWAKVRTFDVSTYGDCRMERDYYGEIASEQKYQRGEYAWVDEVDAARAAEAAQHRQEMEERDAFWLARLADSLKADHERIEALRAERDRLKAALQGLQSDIEHDAHVNQPEAFRNYWRGRLHSEIAALTPQGQSTDGETR